MSAPGPCAARRLFHVAPAASFRTFLASAQEELAPPSLAREGFTHLSFAEQLAGTLRLHFGGASAVALVEVDAGALPGALFLEPSRGGELFPHAYGALPRAALLRWWPLARAGGALLPPRLGRGAEEDRPSGRALPAAGSSSPDA